MSIPSVDLGDFLSGDTGKKKGFVQKLGKAYEDIRLVAIIILTAHIQNNTMILLPVNTWTKD